MRYLDPKADLTFKKVFGEHPDLVMSLLNALLPLEPGREITSIEYLAPEQAPRTPTRKNSIVDVKCRERDGRQFIVEMQMEWTTEFKQRVMFNAAKAYVNQLDKGDRFSNLQPVYSLNLVNDIFEPDKDEFYHYYRMVHERHSDRVIEGLHLVFVELPKFQPHTVSDKKMMVLWLRFLTEVGGKSQTVPPELLENPEVQRAVEIVEESGYTPEEMAGYDKFWDDVRVEKAFINEAEYRYAAGLEKGRAEGEAKGRAEGEAKGRAEGEAKGRAEGEAKGRHEAVIDMARSMKAAGLTSDMISKVTGLDISIIDSL